MILTFKKHDIQTVLNCGGEGDEERNEKKVFSSVRYYVMVHTEDNSQITKRSNNMIYMKSSAGN